MSDVAVTHVKSLDLALMKCSECCFWKKSEKGGAGWRDGLGGCTNVPNFYDVTESVDEYDPEDRLAGDLVLKPVFQKNMAFGLDSSGNQAFLITAPDFGCVSFLPKP